jgi:hypothetical protein
MSRQTVRNGIQRRLAAASVRTADTFGNKESLSYQPDSFGTHPAALPAKEMQNQQLLNKQ